MKKVVIKKIEGYNYTLQCDDKEYVKNIEFYDTKINVGDIMYLPDDVLNEVNLYAYGPIKEGAKEEDIIKVISNDKEIYLERYYG
jgi:hypothetical protein